MKFTVVIDDREYNLELESSGDPAKYRLKGDLESAGTASIKEVAPGVFSILLGTRSFTVHLSRNGAGVETWTGATHRSISLSDTRDRAASSRAANAAGPVEIRAQMPGKVVKLLVNAGDRVEAGQGLVVIEAMKMQNEVISRKHGTVTKAYAREGATVAAGEILMVVE